MGQTPVFNIPFPEGGDLIDNAAIQALAEGVESALDFLNNPEKHVLALRSGWNSNPQVPVTFYAVGRLVVVVGEIYRSSGTEDVVGNIPVAFRPEQERVRVTSISGSNSESSVVISFNSNGELTAAGINNKASTPGYGFSVGYFRV